MLWRMGGKWRSKKPNIIFLETMFLSWLMFKWRPSWTAYQARCRHNDKVLRAYVKIMARWADNACILYHQRHSVLWRSFWLRSLLIGSTWFCHMTRELAFWCTDSVNWRIFSFSSSTVFRAWAPLAPSGAASGISSCMGMWSSSLPGIPCQTGVLILPKAFLKPGPQKSTIKVTSLIKVVGPRQLHLVLSASVPVQIASAWLCQRSARKTPWCPCRTSMPWRSAGASSRKLGKSYLSLHKLSSI